MPSGRKYSPLCRFLTAFELPGIPMTFAEIEEVLGSTLPPWAYEYQAWWANDKSHSQARAWLGAGWKTTHANVNEKSVVFVRAYPSQTSVCPATTRLPRQHRFNDRRTSGTSFQEPTTSRAQVASENIRLLDYHFVHAATIEPERGTDGAPLKFMPHPQYALAETTPLNRHGAGPFCRFRVDGLPSTSGAYALTIDGELAYVGIAKDLARRWGTQGYSRISPRNCYVGGQSTNCKVNNRILIAACGGERIDLWMYETLAPAPVESKVIRHLRPPWNSQRPGDS
jgi:hypothetical protein